jgi:hypothetical protein
MSLDWRNGANFTTQQFLIGLANKHLHKKTNIYKRAFELGEHTLIGPIYLQLYTEDLYNPDTPYCYERAIKLARRSISPYNQHWSSELMYS